MLPVGSMGKALVGVWGLCCPEGHAPSGVHGQSSGGVWGLCRPEADDSFFVNICYFVTVLRMT